MNERDEVNMWSGGALEYLGTIVKSSSVFYKVRCTKCGEIFTRERRGIRDRNTRCPSCYKPKNKGYLRKLERAEFAQLEKSKSKICVICGKTFYSSDERRKTCSHDCATILKKSNAGLKRFRHKGGDVVDYGITLKRVFDRDKGICWICGKRCDFNDVRYTSKGIKYCGDTHPVKDHVIPLSAGGDESWENVRLACWRCNRDKSDAIVDVAETERGARLVVSERCGKKDGSIPIAQLSLNGEFVREYGSISEASRDTGIPVCQISAARLGRQKTAHGFLWRAVGTEVRNA